MLLKTIDTFRQAQKARQAGTMYITKTLLFRTASFAAGARLCVCVYYASVCVRGTHTYTSGGRTAPGSEIQSAQLEHCLR